MPAGTKLSPFMGWSFSALQHFPVSTLVGSYTHNQSLPLHRVKPTSWCHEPPLKMQKGDG